MSFACDLAALDHKYRAKRSGQNKAEYAAAIEIYRRPRKQWPAYLLALAFLVGSFLMLRGV